MSANTAPTQQAVLAIDFGTSNSAAAILHQGRVRRLQIEAGSDTLPTAVFFPARSEAMRIGNAAAQALMDADEGRYMRALKSALGTPLLNESRLIGGRRRTLADVIAAFLAELRQRAGKAAGQDFLHALSGRPVRFHSADAGRDAQAEADLRACYLAAGFESVRFLPEPEAAALACHGATGADGLGLIMDIGGGTSDFSVFRNEAGRVRILASHGIRLGGTDFDQAISVAHAMPLMGMGSSLRRELGPGLLPVPNAIYVDLASWTHIPFCYTPENLRMARQMAKLAVQPDLMDRLVATMTDELGHDLAFAVERGKIAANDMKEHGNGGSASIDMGIVRPGLSAPVTPATLAAALHGFAADLDKAVHDTLTLAGIAPSGIGHVILVGGSSLMGLVTDMAVRILPAARLHRSEAFTAVVDGLALATGAE